MRITPPGDKCKLSPAKDKRPCFDLSFCQTKVLCTVLKWIIKKVVLYVVTIRIYIILDYFLLGKDPGFYIFSAKTNLKVKVLSSAQLPVR